MIRPCNDFVLLEKEKAEEKTASGIILTDKNTEKPTVGKVLAVNNGHEACRMLRQSQRPRHL